VFATLLGITWEHSSAHLCEAHLEILIASGALLQSLQLAQASTLCLPVGWALLPVFLERAMGWDSGKSAQATA
jgi:hypothetical protein